MPKANETDGEERSTTGELRGIFPGLTLTVTFDVRAGGIGFSWRTAEDQEFARGFLCPTEKPDYFVLNWSVELGGERWVDGCNAWPASVRALLKRIRQRVPGAVEVLRFGVLTEKDTGAARGGEWHGVEPRAGADRWRWLLQEIQLFADMVAAPARAAQPGPSRGSEALGRMVCALLGVPPPPRLRVDAHGKPLCDLTVTFRTGEPSVEFVWKEPADGTIRATGRVIPTGGGNLKWELKGRWQTEAAASSHVRTSIRKVLKQWFEQMPTDRSTFTACYLRTDPLSGKQVKEQEPPFTGDDGPYPFLEDNIVALAEAFRAMPSPMDFLLNEPGLGGVGEFQRFERRLIRKEQRRIEEENKRREAMERLAEERRRREEEERRAKAASAGRSTKTTAAATVPPGRPTSGTSVRAEAPPAPVHFVTPKLEFQETSFPLENLRVYQLRERAAVWWVSNQSDDLLCLPHCRIDRLEYQVRTALRVLGPLRGRALLSDEVGLGKTIESGLVIKELLTRGMVKRFLILTVPSLVDQWEEELKDKFGLTTATTNQPGLREDAGRFWRENAGIVASLHTLKQQAHLEVARQVHWDILIVDEAHYLRNRESQAWQAVNALPRQFLLLLTATPVQNSLEELYNLVTLLQPGQLLSPKEFRARFVDPKRPRQPREPEELRRLLGQVMIRNTRANAGIDLPPRRAETVLFQPEAAEAAFWREWETEFRGALTQMNPGQASLWGRLVLQSAGSSPAAWRGSLVKFPDAKISAGWRGKNLLDSTWKKKCELIPPITRIEGGAVIFTQFLETQRALSEYLKQAGVATFVINGSVPAPERQPITEEFRKSGGALLLTHSGTEGRNLQFSHRLVNFDLPWNPMEIEQRIGRLHRLGQKHPVRIYNLVQAGTLQEHLLNILQEKLNLFELVVGETGLILGERFSSDEFAEEIFRRWNESDGQVAESLATLGEELAAARDQYGEVKKLDETLFAKDYESL